MDKEDLLYELTVEIWGKAVAPKWMLDAVRKNLILWAKKYLVDKVKIKKFKETVKMSKLEVKSFEEQMRGAGIAGQLERAEENGYANGLEEGHASGFEEGCENGREETEEKFISQLLKTNTPERISKDYQIDIERVLEIKNKQ